MAKKRCGIGKVWDSDMQSCRKMSPKEKRYVKESTIAHAIAGAKGGSVVGGVAKKKNKADIASGAIGAVAGGYYGYKSGKKSITSKSRHATTKMKGYPEGEKRAFRYKKKKKKK
jgi:uncharacterized protein YcfJ